MPDLDGAFRISGHPGPWCEATAPSTFNRTYFIALDLIEVNADMSKKSSEPVVAPRAPVISLPINVARLKSLGEMVKGSADEEALKVLCERLDVLAVNAFSIEAKVSPWKKRGVQIDGYVRGEVAQSCVVTLAPVVEQIDEPFRITLVPKGSEFAKRAIENATMSEMVIDPEGEDPPEEFEGEEIDVGQYAEEFFALKSGRLSQSARCRIFRAYRGQSRF